MVNEDRNVFILGSSADIGLHLLKSFRQDGWNVGGTFRKSLPSEVLKELGPQRFISCDFSSAESVKAVGKTYGQLGENWDVVISSIGTMEPVGRFMDVDFDTWKNSIEVNLISQLRAIHALYPYRKKNQTSHVVFFAGGGTNNAFPNYSAYCVSKIALIKMCELLDNECPDLNVFIVGPGWVRTKIHEETLKSGASAGENYTKTREFLDSGKTGTSLDDIYQSIVWGIEQGRDVIGGRNFSVVHDPWKNPEFGNRLKSDSNIFKLRRFNPLEVPK